jgi:hypothetical protein
MKRNQRIQPHLARQRAMAIHPPVVLRPACALCHVWPVVSEGAWCDACARPAKPRRREAAFAKRVEYKDAQPA